MSPPTTTELPSLPIIDISSFLSSTPDVEAKKQTAQSLYAACHDIGFFYLTGHGIPVKMQQAVLDATREFFLNAGEKEKAAISRKEVDEGGDGARGWQRLGENVTMGMGDWHEAIDLYHPALPTAPSSPPYEQVMGPNLWPSHPANFRTLYESYVVSLYNLGLAVMRAMALALGSSDEDLFVRKTYDSFWVMRAIGYPPLPAGAKGVSCGAHTDYGCTTFLLADNTVGALQVLGKDGETWLNADPMEGAYVVNIGDMVEVWTNGLWKSTVHRVIHRGERFRVSVPFFFEPDWDARVEPLQICVDRTGGVPKYKKKVYGEHLLSKVAGNFYKGKGEEKVTFPETRIA